MMPFAWTPARRLLLAQLAGTLIALALVPGNFAKLACFVVLWAVTFRRITRNEGLLFLAMCVLFTVMNTGALKQGVFFFRYPDWLGMPIYEFFMWGFYVLHLIRFVGGPAPKDDWKWAVALAVVFSVPFSTVSNDLALLGVTAAILAVAFWRFHEPLDFAYAGYLALLGALFEYVGVWSGQWGYPKPPVGGVPFWFLTMWGGVGLFARRLCLRFVV